MNLPKKIRLGFREIDVIEFDRLVRADGNISNSTCSMGEITIQSTIPDQIKKKVLFKQLIYLIQLHLDTDLNVTQKHILSNCMWAVVRDNPVLHQPKTIPNIVHVLGTDINICMREADWNCDGGTINSKDIIEINNVLKPVDKWCTLWHEIMEVIWSDMEFPENNRERDIESFSFLLCSAFADNDFSWVISDEESS
jgi:hypothetical protein